MRVVGHCWASQVVVVVKKLPAIKEYVRDAGSIPGQEDPLEEEIATHYSSLSWRIPWIKSLAGYSPQSHTELDTIEATCHAHKHGIVTEQYDVFA